MKLQILYMVGLSILSSCNFSTNTEKKEEHTDSLTKDNQISYSLGNNESQNSKTGEESLKTLLTNKQQVTKQLNNSSKEEANRLYREFYKQNEIILTKLTDENMNVLDKFYEESSSDEIRKLGQLLIKYDLEFNQLGEGYVEIRTKPDYYYEIFKNHTSEDYSAYLFLISEENKVTYAADAGLVISFKDLADRIIYWEKFITTYPNSTLIAEVKETYHHYQRDYIFGLDNTPSQEKKNDKHEAYINDENLKEYKRFLKDHPDSPTAQLVKIFLENFDDEKIYEMINNQIQKQN